MSNGSPLLRSGERLSGLEVLLAQSTVEEHAFFGSYLPIAVSALLRVR
jgi:hypothetical protein